MAIQVFHKTEAGKGIEFAEGKYNVKAGKNVTVDETGVNADIPVKAPLEKDADGSIKLADGTLTDVTVTEGNLVKTKADGSTENVALPAAPTAVTGGSISGNTITLPKSDGTSDTIELPAIPVDISLDDLVFTNEGKLKATLTNGSIKETDFTAEVVVKAIESADDAQKQRIVDALKDKLLSSLRGTEVQDSSGKSEGYLLPTE